MEEIGTLALDELAKQGLLGLAILVLGAVIVVLWRDNLRLRNQREVDQAAREKRDDARFDEVKALAETSSAALAKSAAAETALGASLSHTNEIVEKQGDLIEARTATFNKLDASLLLVEAGLKGLKDEIDRQGRAR